MTVMTTNLLTTAESLGDLIEATVPATELAGTMPSDVVEALKESGLFNIMVPRELGGQGAEVTTFVRVVEELSRLDPSTGWSYMANSCSAAIFAAFLQESAAREVFLGDHGSVTAGMLAPAGTATTVDGGYILNGNYSFASGSGHADWIGSGGMRQVDGKAQPFVSVIPRSQVEFLGNWDVLGLAGTGSFDYRVTEQFVPEEFTFLRVEPPTLRGQASLHLGNITLALAGHVGVSLGTAKRAIEELVKVVDAGKSRPGFPAIREQQLFLHDFAVLEAKFQSSRHYAMDALEEAVEAVESETGLTPLHGKRIHQATTFATNAAMDVVESCYRWSGSAGLRNPHPLGRLLRDMHAQTQHVFVDANSLTSAGSALLDAYRQ